MLAVTIVASMQLHAQSGNANVEEKAERLIALRAQVEELNQELDLLKQEHRADMGALAAQKAELEANRKRQETTLKQIEQQIAENREKAAAAGVDNDKLKPVLLTAIDELETHIAASIPFKIEERQAELGEIRTQLESDILPANRAANRLWAFYEDEIRLTRENGIYSQTIELNSERVLADVAKLGTVMMYFRTNDGTYGEVVRSGDGWRYEILSAADQVAAVENLFDSLQKQIRQGFFELPNTLAGRGARS